MELTDEDFRHWFLFKNWCFPLRNNKTSRRGTAKSTQKKLGANFWGFPERSCHLASANGSRIVPNNKFLTIAGRRIQKRYFLKKVIQDQFEVRTHLPLEWKKGHFSFSIWINGNKGWWRNSQSLAARGRGFIVCLQTEWTRARMYLYP